MSKSQKTYFDIPISNYNINDFSSATGFSYTEEGSNEVQSVIIDKNSTKKTQIAVCALLDALIMIDEDVAQMKASLKEDAIFEMGTEHFKFKRHERYDTSVSFSLIINNEEFEFSFVSDDDEYCELIFKLESTLRRRICEKDRLIDDIEKHNKDLGRIYYKNKRDSFLTTFFSISMPILALVSGIMLIK